MKKITLAAFLISSLFAVNANSATKEYDDRVTRLHFSESAKKEVVDDRYISTLRYETKEGSERAFLQREVNRMMKLAIEIVHPSDELKVSTGVYSVNRVWKKNGKSEKWRALQEITIDTSNKEVLLDIVGELQDKGFAVRNLTTYLSDVKKDSYQNELIQSALNRMKQRAKLVAKEMDRHEVKFLDVKINSNNSHQSPRIMHMRAESSMLRSSSKPTLESTSKTISVNVSAVVSLKD